MPQPEAKFKKQLIKAYLERYPKGWYYYAAANRKLGVPDLYFSVAGDRAVSLAPRHRGVWVEAKVDKNPTSKLQLRVHEKMRAAGEIVLVVRLVNPSTTALRKRVETADALPRHSWFFEDIASESFWHRMLS